MTNPQNPYGNDDNKLPSYGDSATHSNGVGDGAGDGSAGAAGAADAQPADGLAPRFPGTGGDAGYGDASYSGYGDSGHGGSGYGESGYAGADSPFQQEDPALHKKSVLALIVLIVGILSAILGLFVVGLFLGVVGVILGVVALVRNRKKVGKARRTWMTILGMILSVVGIVISIVLTNAVLQTPEIQKCMYDANGNVRATEEVQACMDELTVSLEN